jgi:hypothetical protein
MKRSVLLAVALTLALTPAARAEGFFQTYSFSLGLGSAVAVDPEEFKDAYNPAFGLMMSFGAQRGLVELAVDFDYNFFLLEETGSITPDDVNILNIFLMARIKPLKSKARPYLLFGGGYYRFWIVNQNFVENVLGYTGGVGFEAELNKRQRIFFEVRITQGQTRDNPTKENTVTVPGRLGLTWMF